MSQRWRSIVIVPSIIIVFAVLGGFFGPEITGAAAASSEDELKASLKTFSKIYEMVEDNFADKVNADKALYNGAIPGMLRTLDPHSSFFDPRAFQILREDQKGHYYGVGMYVASRNGKTIVITPFPGAPAYKAGIRPGDVILEVNGKSTEKLNTTEVADLLKGPKGTPVRVMVAREGRPQPLSFEMVRDEIPRKSVQEAFFVRPGIAHVEIDQFNENTSREVDETLKKLGENNIKGLILDLRDNPGGLLNEGVAVADRFLQKGQSIVAHRGRVNAEKPYVARSGNNGREYPVVVLVNRLSASAAEIVAGALQDHDRAWILGENTFGKGLVQTVYPLSENTGLALTTARYYTPSGRLIQRDYTNTSFFDYYYRKNLEAKNPLDAKPTDSGRIVYGGGGIAPDEKFSGTKLNRLQAAIIRNYAMLNFTAQYFGRNDIKTVAKDWQPDQGILNDLRQYLLREAFQFTEAEFGENETWIRQQIRREVFIAAFSLEDSRKITLETDPVVLKAVESMSKAKELIESAKKMVVQRVTRQPRP